MIALTQQIQAGPGYWSGRHRTAPVPTVWSDHRLLFHFWRELPKDTNILLPGCGRAQCASMIGGQIRPKCELTVTQLKAISSGDHNRTRREIDRLFESSVRPDHDWVLADYSDGARAEAYKVTSGSKTNVTDMSDFDMSLDWPFADKSYGIVILTEILEFLPDPLFAIREAARVGRFIAATMPIHDSLLTDEAHRWKFEPVDPWRLIPGTHRVHHLKSSKLLVSFSKP